MFRQIDYEIPQMKFTRPKMQTMNIYTHFIKPGFDKCFALFFLVLHSPILLIVATVLAFSNHGAILFRQERPGKDCKPFKLVKFKTMLDPVDALGNEIPSLKRVTPLGNFLRKWSLDELRPSCGTF